MGRPSKSSEKVQREDRNDSLPVYRSEESTPKKTQDQPPSYEEAVEDNWNDGEFSDAGRNTRLARRQKDQDPPCSHWSESGCQMTVESRKCCSCLDNRPKTESGLYPTYVDGQGYVERATRWQFYCPNCKEYFDPDAKERFLRDQCAWVEKRAQSLADERDRKYFGLRRYIQRCGEALKSCFPE